LSDDVAVSDASPLIALYQIGHLELLRNLFDRVIVPLAVTQEVAPSVGTLPIWVHRQQAPPPPDLARHLDVGEREAIALAVHLGADFVVMDDRPGRNVAERLRMDVIGTLGLLVRARRRGLIRSVRPMVDQLVSNGLYVSVHLYREILEAVDEADG
jgi:predicted nucleic acid-binding protein